MAKKTKTKKQRQEKPVVSKKAEKIDTSLTPKQEMFCKEFLVDLNATQAAIRAGYSQGTARQIASENLSKLVIQEKIQALMEARSARTEITADYVLQTIAETVERCREARPLLDMWGNQVFVNDQKGRPVAAVFTFKPNEVLKGAELLGKNLKLFNEKVEHSGKVTLEVLVAGSMDEPGKE